MREKVNSHPNLCRMKAGSQFAPVSTVTQNRQTVLSQDPEPITLLEF